VSDGSDDRTPELVRQFAAHGVKSMHQAERRGKSAALNRAVAGSRGEILVFSDANCLYARDALRRLTYNLLDPEVGGVTGRKQIHRDPTRESTRGDRSFWNVESALKTWESRLGSIPVADGEIFAIRRSCYEAIPPSIINDDAFLTFRLVRGGYRVVYEPDAISEEPASRTLREDFRVKARIVYGGMQTLAQNANWLLPPRSLFSLQFLVHKVARHLLPIWLFGLLASSAVLAIADRRPEFVALLTVQLGLYGLAAIGYALQKFTRPPALFYFPLYFSSMSLAALVGLTYYARAVSPVKTWKKAER
jgi:cellulose synthase/poly-beta-1,6-N-acetylglucosamine synthase-like glycosyltransferase